MHNSESRLNTLEHALQAAGVDVFLLPMADEFQGEYTPECAKRLPYITGFDGSAGLGAFWAKADAPHTLFVDGRYTLQAAAQVSNRMTVVNSGEMSLVKWLALYSSPHRAKLCSPSPSWGEVRRGAETSSALHGSPHPNPPPGGEGTTELCVAYDPWLTTHKQLSTWREALRDRAIVWVPLSPNPVDAIWHDRPAAPAGEVVLHPLEYAGRSYVEKRQEILDAIAAKNADAQLLTLPDGINWLLNIRGSDIPFNPLLLCYFLLRKDGSATLFTTARVFSESVAAFFAEHGIEVVAVPFPSPSGGGLGRGLSHTPHSESAPLLTSPQEGEGLLLLDPASAASAWWSIAETQGWKLIEAPDPTLLPKSFKNATELAGVKAAHMRDGLALSRFLCWLDGQVEARRLPTELEVVEKLESFRAGDAMYRGASFATIAGSGPNGAIVHYRANAASNRRLALGELFLLDSGGQYPDGTTDVTRTVAIATPTVGTPSDDMRKHFTLVLKGHIALASARFPKGTTGAQLDVLARQYLWAAGLDYDHGTGHGVGAYLCVHEGPQSISKRPSAALAPGMIVSNEPGYYKEGAYGIRIENLVAVVENAQGTLGFETLTLAPLDIRLVDSALLTNDEHNWLNSYHRRVYNTLSSHLSPSEAAWLAGATRAI